MRTLDPRVIAALKSGAQSLKKRFYLYRRIYVGGAYLFDSAIEVTELFKDMDTVKFKLDTETYGVFNISNVTLTFDNSKNQFKQNNIYGLFPSSTAGLLQKSKFVINTVVELDDGTELPVAVFTGYLKDKPVYNLEEKSVDLPLSGNMSIFDDYLAETSPNGYNGELLSTLVTDEVLGSGSGTVFTTANNATGIIVAVKKGLTASGPSAATALTPSTDYSVSNLNEHDLPATVTLKVAIVSNQSCWVTYRYWYLDKRIEWVVSQICELCGITNTNITAAIFSNSIKSIYSQSSESEFLAGTFDNTFMGYYYPTGTYGVVPDSIPGTFELEGVYYSPVINAGASVAGWGQFNASYLSPANTNIIFYWRESDDGATWGAWNEILPGSGCPSIKQYLQLKVYEYSDYNDYYPYLFSWSIEYFYSTTLIPVVNMTGLTFSDALKSLAEMCAYEIGFDLSDTFLFRPRSNSSTSVMTMDGDYIAEVVNWDDGRDKVYNVIQVTFGDYSKTADSTTQAEVSPTSQEKYGSIILTVSNGNFVPASSVDLAYAIAPTVWDYTSQPRRRATIKTLFCLNLELGDNMTMQCPEPSVLKLWKYGDTDVVYGDDSICFYDEDMAKAMLSLYNVQMRVEGIEWDMMNWKTTFNFTEVL